MNIKATTLTKVLQEYSDKVYMKEILSCRRTFLAFYAITILGFLTYTKSIDSSVAIAGIIASIAGANAYEKRPKQSSSKKDNPSDYFNR